MVWTNSAEPFAILSVSFLLTHKAPNTTIAEFANAVDPDETAHNEPSHLDLKCLPYSLTFQHYTVYIEFFFENLSSAFLAFYWLKLFRGGSICFVCVCFL